MSMFNFFAGLLDSSVGNNMANKPDDIRKAKRNLHNAGYLDDANDDIDNPILTRAMNDGIKNFQKDRGLKVDGIMKPAGETEHRILEVLEKRNADDVFGKLSRMSLSEEAVQHDATGRMIQDSPRPVPTSKPENSQHPSPILQRVDNKTAINEIIEEEGDPAQNNFMFKDTAEDGGKVTVAGGILLNRVEDAVKLPFTAPDGKGGRRPATKEEIEAAFKVVNDFKQPKAAKDKQKASSFDPEQSDYHDIRLPADVAQRLFNESIRSSANELRRKFSGFDDLPDEAQRALLDMEFNLGGKFNKEKWPNLFDAIQRRDWERAAEESKRKEEGSKGMEKRNARIKKRFLEILKQGVS